MIAFGVARPGRLGGGTWHSRPSPASRPQFIAVAAIAGIVVFFVLSRISIIPDRNDVLRQVLLTVGFAFLFQQGALDIWGGNNMDINPPRGLHRTAS